MSTRSAIILNNSNGTFRGIYCHSDGYPEGVGATLNEHYTDLVKINELLDLGDISCLGSKVKPEGDKHSFEYSTREDDVVVAYGRDRGEKGTEARTAGSWKLVAKRWSDIEYAYVFANNKWTCHKL